MKTLEIVDVILNLAGKLQRLPQVTQLLRKALFPLHANFDLKTFSKDVEDRCRYLQYQKYKKIVDNDFKEIVGNQPRY